MRKMNIIKFMLNSVFDRIVGIAVKSIKNSINNYLIHGIDIKQSLGNDLLKLVKYFKEKSLISIVKDFSDLAFTSTNMRLIKKFTDAFIDALGPKIWKYFVIKGRELLISSSKLNKNFRPYVSLNASVEIKDTLPYQILTICFSVFCSRKETILIHLIGFSLMTATEAWFFVFYSNDYYTMLLEASQGYPIEPELFYDMDKLSQLQEDLNKTLNINETLENADTSIADQTEPKKSGDIYTKVFAVGIIFITVVTFCYCNGAL